MAQGIDWNPLSWTPLSWFSNAASSAGNWLGGLGGKIASGIEGGLIAVFKDVVDSVEGYFLLTIGITIIVLAMLIYFIGDAVKILPVIGQAISMAAA